MPEHAPPSGQHDERITRLEEAHGFSDHRLDQLEEQLAALNRALDAAARRIAALEARAAHDQAVRDHHAVEPPPEHDPPPHW